MRLDRHRTLDANVDEPGQREREQKTIRTLSAKAKKVREIPETNEDRIGTQGKPVNSSITDNESATVDEKHLIVVDAQAHGDGHEAKHVDDVIEQVDATFRKLDSKLDICRAVVITADSGFLREDSVRADLSREVHAYIADTHFRSQDPRFASQQEHTKKTIDRDRTSTARKYFRASEFVFNEEGQPICPAGKPMRQEAR